jgi:hypothetical protein
LHRLENLNNVNGWGNREIVPIIREQHTGIAWALDSRKSHEQLVTFSKVPATVDSGSLERHSLGSAYVPAEIGRKSNSGPMNFIPFEVFSMEVFVNAMVSPFLI